MSDSTWEQLEQLTKAMALLLLREKVPVEPVLLSAPCERAIDEWVQNYARGARPEFVFPTDADLRRGLLARLRYATAFATQARLFGLPIRSSSGALIGLEELLVIHWHATARERWLSGEKGVAPSEN